MESQTDTTMCVCVHAHTQRVSKIVVDNLRIKSRISVIRGSKTQVGIRNTPALEVKRKQPVNNPEMHANQCEASRNLRQSEPERIFDQVRNIMDFQTV